MALRDVVGQERAINILLRTIQRERIPSSYLFVGESGVGKKYTAINFAKAVNCLSRERRAKSEEASDNIGNPSSPRFGKEGMGGFERDDLSWSTVIDCCDECFSCKKIDAGVHPDFLLAEPHAGQIRIEEIRAIDDTLSLKPFEGRWKVVIVDEAHMMNSYAANAFLKTLEEPPKESLLILISSNPDRLPETILSRCSRVNFTPLSNEACRMVIQRYISQKSNPSSPPPFNSHLGKGGHRGVKGGHEGITQKTSTKKPESSDSIVSSDNSQLSTLVRLSMGRPGLAITEDLIEEREWFLELFQEMMRAEKDSWTSKEEIERWFDLIVLILRDMTVMQITQDEKNLINIDLGDYMRKFSSSMDLKGIIENYQTLNTLKGYLNFNLNKSLTWNYAGAILRGLRTEH